MKHLKKIFVVIILLISAVNTNAQNNPIAGLEDKLGRAADNTTKAQVLDSLSMYYLFYSQRYDSAFYYANQSIDNAFLMKDKKYLILAYARLSFYYYITSEHNAGLSIAYKGLQLAEQYKISDYTATLYYDISFIYYSVGDSTLGIQNAVKGIQALPDNKDPFYDIRLHLYGQFSGIYADGGNNDSALLFLHKLDSVAAISKERAAKDISYLYWTNFYFDNNNYIAADSVITLGIASCKKNSDFLLSAFYLYRTNLLFNQKKYQETITTARVSSNIIIGTGGKADVFMYMRASYAKLGKMDSAYFYIMAADSVKTVLQNQNNLKEVQQVLFNQQLNKKEAEAENILEKEKSRSKLITYIFLTAVIFFLLFGFIQYRNNLQKKKVNNLLKQEKDKVDNTLHELKSTQAQLVQSEKMASLGELTAGIAHEIQNPLNFVNNFSELNKELVDELQVELKNGNTEEAIAISNDIKENEERINHHGKRADGIVKGMLEHTRASSGQKESTDINKLTDEYLQIAYHGLRAKDKFFNTSLITNYDVLVGSADLIAQDIARVLLNIYNNAFYAVNEKAKQEPTNYEPTVTVTTKKINDKIEIRIADNGNGIPEKVIDKIFQPFFTTKPTGQGTGLGLSLSYDIIKAHRGEIKVDTKEGDGTTFIVQLAII